VLGAIDSGVGFEKRLNQIYQTCRTAQEIETAFDELQKELEDVINERLKKTHRSLLENFDEEVVQKLKMRHIDDTKRVNTYNRTFWLLTNSVLSNQITEIDDNAMSFVLPNSPLPSIPNGRYILNKNSGESHQLRIGHPLGEYIVSEARKAPSTPLDICFRLDEHPFRKSLLEEQRGHSGISFLYKVMSWNEHDSQEDIICCTKNDLGACLPDDFVKALLQVVPESYKPTSITDDDSIAEELETLGEEIGVTIRCQRADIFEKMHRL
jgi:hypothetical protein